MLYKVKRSINFELSTQGKRLNLDLRFFTELEKEIGDMLERHAAELVTGKATDWADYKYRSGYMKALRDVLEAAREANKRVIGIDDNQR